MLKINFKIWLLILFTLASSVTTGQRIQRIQNVVASTDWTPAYPGNGRKIALPPGKVFALPPRFGYSNQTYLNAGVTHLALTNATLATDVPANKQAVFKDQAFSTDLTGKLISQWTDDDCRFNVLMHFVNNIYTPDYLQARSANPGRSFTQWSRQEFENAVINERNQGNGPMIWTDGYAEKANFAGEFQIIVNNSDQDANVRKWIQFYLPNGALNCGGYDGDTKVSFGNIGPTTLQTILNSDASALTYCQQNPNFGNNFFSGSAYNYRHGLLQFYWTGVTRTGQELLQMLASINMHYAAKRAVGTTKETITFLWPNNTQFNSGANYDILQHYERTLINGGKFIANYYAKYPYNAQLAQTFFGLVMTKGVYLWEDGNRFGNDKNVVMYDQDRLFYYQGPALPSGGVMRTNAPGASVKLYDPNIKYPYPGTPQNDWDACWQAADWYSQGYAHAGDTWRYAASRLNSSDSWTNQNSKSYEVDRFIDGKPVFIEGGNIGGKRWLFAIAPMLRRGQYTTRQVLVNGNIYTVKLEGSVCYFYLIN